MSSVLSSSPPGTPRSSSTAGTMPRPAYIAAQRPAGPPPMMISSKSVMVPPMYSSPVVYAGRLPAVLLLEYRTPGGSSDPQAGPRWSRLIAPWHEDTVPTSRSTASPADPASATAASPASTSSASNMPTP